VTKSTNPKGLGAALVFAALMGACDASSGGDGDGTAAEDTNLDTRTDADAAGSPDGAGEAPDSGQAEPTDVASPDAASPDGGSEDTSPSDSTTSDAEVEPQDCADGLPRMSFSEGPYGFLRHEVAGDFVVPLEGGGKWRFSEEFSGCDSLVFIPDTLPVSALDPTSLWQADLDTLVNRSPDNVHYFFVSRLDGNNGKSSISSMKARVDALLAALPEAEATHWGTRLHVVAVSANKLDAWIADAFSSHGQGGFGVDRLQRVRGLGGFADVTRIDPALEAAGQWPWKGNLAYAAHEPMLWNFELTRHMDLLSRGSTDVWLWQGETLEQFAITEVELPSAAEMLQFDTLEIDVESRCPNDMAPEQGNCGAWDYLAHLFLQNEDGTSVELARFITTYHRESRWVVDATPALALLAAGGKHTFKWEFAPEWNKQPTKTLLALRFSNKGRGVRPVSTLKLWNGGPFGPDYDALHAPQSVPIPATAKRVELWALVTGHGAATNQCAEFCNHQHEFTVNQEIFLKTHPVAGTQSGCVGEISKGMTPNQSGTWWFGRGGWCPGQYVAPWVVDLTDTVAPGANAELSYRGLFNGKTPPANAGDIVLSAYLVIYE
jgi:hypothetical protein